MAGLTSSWIFCLAALVALQVDRVTATCTVATRLPHGGMQCLSLMGAVDDGVSQADICTMFQEVVACITQRTQEDGQKCDFDTVRQTVVHFSSQADWLDKLHLDTCQVSAPTTSICKDAQRLTVFGTNICGAYLREVHAGSSNCKQASLLYESCVHRNLPHAGCTPQDILATVTCTV